MSDETTVSNDQTLPEGTGQQTPSERTFTQSELDQIINARLSREREKYADYEEKSKRLAELETAQMTELEKAQRLLDDERRAREQAEAQFKAAQLESLRLQVATEKGLPVPLAGRLNGATKEELEADADGLLEMFKLEKTPRTAPNLDGGKGTRQTSDGSNYGLTPDELEFARLMKIDPKTYAENKRQEQG